MKKHILYYLCILFTLYPFKTKAQNLSCRCHIEICDTTPIEKVCKLVEVMPHFQTKKYPTFLEYLWNELHLIKPVNTELETLVYITFIIDSNGKLIRPQILGKMEVDYSLNDKEIVKVLNSSPDWNPGVCHGKKVPIFMKLPLKIMFHKD